MTVWTSVENFPLIPLRVQTQDREWQVCQMVSKNQHPAHEFHSDFVLIGPAAGFPLTYELEVCNLKAALMAADAIIEKSGEWLGEIEAFLREDNA